METEILKQPPFFDLTKINALNMQLDNQTDWNSIIKDHYIQFNTFRKAFQLGNNEFFLYYAFAMEGFFK